jgi:exonuclease SbcC
MIPKKLTLINFLSYRETTLDFQGLHIACICGANGAGKSSLLEAITWVIWGETRAATEDDIIHTGQTNVRVDFTFISNNQTYRIIRSRSRGKNASLELQIENKAGEFSSLTAKGMRATQKEIITYLKLDYDTFINSAYLRQGRADEFMLHRPSERKQILVDLLKLSRYEELASKAKEKVKEFKIRSEQLTDSLPALQTSLADRDNLIEQKQEVIIDIKQIKHGQQINIQQLEKLKELESQRYNWELQVTWQENNDRTLLEDCDRLEKDLVIESERLKELENVLEKEQTIVGDYQKLLALEKEEENLSAKFQEDRDLQQQIQQLKTQLVQQINQINLQITTAQGKLESLQQQERELQELCQDSEEIQLAVQKLNERRQQLEKLDRLQQQVFPLYQRRQNLQTEIEKIKAKQTAKLEQLKTQENECNRQLAQLPKLRAEAIAKNQEIEYLEKQQVYQQRIHDKGSEKKALRAKLEENQLACHKQLKELQQKVIMLQTPEATCPLCEQALDESHHHRVVSKTQNQQEEIQSHVWELQKQMTLCEQELQNLREEYSQISEGLKSLPSLQQQLGQLEGQLDAISEVRGQLQAIEQEIKALESSLAIGNYAQELQSELKEIAAEIERLNYNEQTHSLLRTEVDKLRWAEIKQSKLEDAKNKLNNIAGEKPKLEIQIQKNTQAIARLETDSELQQQINSLEKTLLELGYNRDRHQTILTNLPEARKWQIKYQEFQKAQLQYPKIELSFQELEQRLKVRKEDRKKILKQLALLKKQMEKMEDRREEINLLELEIHQQRQHLDELISRQGSLEQQLLQIEKLTIQHERESKSLEEFKRKQIVYEKLAEAFGKNGIQALTIENILPQLEAETNQILARLSGNQLHVQFFTQKMGKDNKKLIDTLDILIADARGTRAYETYSGGEAFRINFSIRLALAKLLAQRAGTALQMLIVDEGFGTQDSEGCDRLIAAINAIAADFACILTVTHMPQFKEAFQTRIEVRKTDKGSKLILST